MFVFPAVNGLVKITIDRNSFEGRGFLRSTLALFRSAARSFDPGKLGNLKPDLRGRCRRRRIVCHILTR